MSLSKEILEKMSLEEKIGQLFFVRPEALKNQINCDKKPTIKISDIQKESLAKYNVGGIAFFGKNIISREQVIKYINDLQNNSKYTLFIGADEEGGLVRRLSNNEDIGVTKFPNMREIQNTKDALNVGTTLGKEMKDLGFNLDFAPVADVQTNPNNKIIGNRAFSTDAKEASKMVEAVVKGFLKENFSSTLKHFPGHGDTLKDSHIGIASSDAGLNTLLNREMLPFEAGIKAGTDFIMTGHISLPNILSNHMPATMSKEIITGILRDTLNFKKIIITDSLEMKAILNYYKTDEIITNCIMAGIDVLLMPKNLEEYFTRLKRMIIDEKIKEERINESTKRILDVKVERGIIK
ncbi:MAG: glycoside hydrolase family 3 protein [Bacilli bacterium]|nr:glycoside hydrolase family 3 protein [Bacilli bacterium]